jgi:DNA helicase HerA-like ATPase
MYNIKSSEHVFISGFTGSGKSFLAMKYLQYPQKHTIALDVKGDMKGFDEDEIITSINELHDIDFKQAKTPLKILYRPSIYEMDEEHYEEFFKFIYNLKNCTVFVDEVTAVCPSPLKMLFWYKSILSRGRSRNTNVFSLSQRPKDIPQYILSESTHYFIFHLNTLNDRKRIFDNTGLREFLNNPLQQYHFYYYNNITGFFKEGVLV